MIVPGSANPLLASTDAGGYTINKSLRLRSSASAYLSRTPASATNRQKLTFSFWVKRGLISYATNALYMFDATASGIVENPIVFNSGDQLDFWVWNGTSFDWQLTTSQLFRDPSSWYHIVIAFDTTQATASNRVKLYVNGSQVTAFATSNYPAQNYNLAYNTTNTQYIGRQNSLGRYFDGYMAEVNFIDGQQLTPSSFGETDSVTGVWKPKAYSGTYGTNGFYLKFTDVATTSGSNAGLGKDFSGNGNYWTTNNISVTSGSTYDSMTDVPTLTDANTANYAVMNPLIKASVVDFSNGNLKLTKTGGVDQDCTNVSTLAMASGKWYWEIKLDVLINTGNAVVGVCKSTYGLSAYSGANLISFGHSPTNQAYRYGTLLGSLSSNMAQGDVLGFALDMDSGSLAYYKNNSLIYTTTGIDTTVPHCAFWSSYKNTEAGTMNFGAGSGFTYTPPTGYKALNTYNLPDSTIVAGNKYMDAKIWTGDGSTSRAITGLNFSPDFLWVKTRSLAGQAHQITDSVRGYGTSAMKTLYTNQTAAEESDKTNSSLTVYYGNVQSLDSAGFTVGAGSGGSVAQVNNNNETYVAWAWDANGAGSSNTSGSITSTVSVNASAGFSIVTYTGNGTSGATIGHGLGVAPSLIILKCRNIASRPWPVYTAATGNTNSLFLNQTDAVNANVGWWNNTSPTSSVFTVGNSLYHNESGGNFVAYCWAEIAGFSKFGSFSGNASTDNAFIYTGFRPKFVLMKRTDASDKWIIWDSARNTYNYVSNELYPNASDAEGVASSTYSLDFVSNGIKVRNAGITGTWIYACFGENPFKNSLAR